MSVLSARANIYATDACELQAEALRVAEAFAGDGSVTQVKLDDATLVGPVGTPQAWAAVATITVDTDPKVEYPEARVS